jgi:hypothetical protein
MQKVRITRTVSFSGKMFLRGREVILNDAELTSLDGRYELIESPKKLDIKPKAAALTKPPKTTAVTSPRSRKRKKVVKDEPTE